MKAETPWLRYNVMTFLPGAVLVGKDSAWPEPPPFSTWTALCRDGYSSQVNRSSTELKTICDRADSL